MDAFSTFCAQVLVIVAVFMVCAGFTAAAFTVVYGVVTGANAEVADRGGILFFGVFGVRTLRPRRLVRALTTSGVDTASMHRL
jgi:hypothetical protein